MIDACVFFAMCLAAAPALASKVAKLGCVCVGLVGADFVGVLVVVKLVCGGSALV